MASTRSHIAHNKPRTMVSPPISRKIFDTRMWSINTKPATNTPAMLPIVLAAMINPLERPTSARLCVASRIM